MTTSGDRSGQPLGEAKPARTVSPDAEARLLPGLEAAPDAIIGTDTAGRIMLVNTRAERLFGYPRGQLKGQLVEILMPDVKGAAQSGLRMRHTADPRPGPADMGVPLAARRRDGAEFSVEISMSTVSVEDGELFLLAVRVAAERGRGERRLQESGPEPENEDRMQGVLLARTSHELRTPLQAIIGFTGTLLLRLPGPLNDEQERELQLVQASAEQLLSLINRLSRPHGAPHRND